MPAGLLATILLAPLLYHAAYSSTVDVPQAWPGRGCVSLLTVVSDHRSGSADDDACVRARVYLFVLRNSETGKLIVERTFGPLWDTKTWSPSTISQVLDMAPGSVPTVLGPDEDVVLRACRTRSGMIRCDSLSPERPERGWQRCTETSVEVVRKIVGWGCVGNQLQYIVNPDWSGEMFDGTLARIHDPWLVGVLKSADRSGAIDRLLITRDRRCVLACPSTRKVERDILIWNKTIRRDEVLVFVRPDDSPQVIRWPLRTFLGSARILSCKAGVGLLSYESWDPVAKERLPSCQRGLVLVLPFPAGRRHFFPIGSDDDIQPMLFEHDEEAGSIDFWTYQGSADWRTARLRLFSWFYERSRVSVIHIPMTDLFQGEGNSLVPIRNPKRLLEEE